MLIATMIYKRNSSAKRRYKGMNKNEQHIHVAQLHVYDKTITERITVDIAFLKYR